MAGIAYVDSSALLKIAVFEPETAALEADLANREGLVSSRLAALECRRAALRASSKRVIQAVEQALDAIYLVDVTPAILERAARLEPAVLRSLDAIHLATALSVDEPHLEVITYDRRMANAAAASGLRVVQPSRVLGF